MDYIEMSNQIKEKEKYRYEYIEVWNSTYRNFINNPCKETYDKLRQTYAYSITKFDSKGKIISLKDYYNIPFNKKSLIKITAELKKDIKYNEKMIKITEQNLKIALELLKGIENG